MSGVDDRLARVLKLVAQQPATPGADRGVAGTLRRVCGAAASALSAAGAGVSVMAENGVRGMAAASDPASERIEELQFTLGEGPCLDAFADRRPVLVPDLANAAMSRWPIYTPAVCDRGVRAVFAFPLQVGAARLGVLDVFRGHSGPLAPEDLGLALTFADVALTTMLDAQDGTRPGAAGDGLGGAMAGRGELFQAQGMVMVQLGVSLTDALARIRAHAYAEGRHLHEVARDIVAHRLRLDRDRP